MKKITLFSIALFAITLGFLLIGGFFSAGTQTSNALISNSSTKTFDINSAEIDLGKLDVKSAASNSQDTFTIDEVAKHKTRDDCYLIINNNIYDVSSYINYHPGGSRTITSRCGKEVTGIFANIHSNRAWDLLKRYKLGTISTDKIDSTPQELMAISGALQTANPTAEIIKIRPKNDFYVAKVIYDGKLYEVHLSNQGEIINEEIEDDESDWSLWENDEDDK